jgi:hypothetical protein
MFGQILTYSNIHSVCSASHYAAIFIPHSPGAVQDLARHAELGNIISHFWQEKSEWLLFKFAMKTVIRVSCKDLK